MPMTSSDYREQAEQCRVEAERARAQKSSNGCSYIERGWLWRTTTSSNPLQARSGKQPNRARPRTDNYAQTGRQSYCSIPFTGPTARMDAIADATLRSAKPTITMAPTGTWRHMRARQTASS